MESQDEYLRSSVFYNLLKDAIVFDDYWQAVEYRKYLTKSGVLCPMLYSLDGRQIGKDGVLDPNERNSINQLDYIFGEYFGGNAKLLELQERKSSLGLLNHLNSFGYVYLLIYVYFHVLIF